MRAPNWATVQVGTGRTVKEVAGELACDWHTVNDAVTTYGKALLEADRKRMNKTSAISLDETKFVKLGPRAHADYATTIVDVEHHQIIDVESRSTLRRHCASAQCFGRTRRRRYEVGTDRRAL